MTNHPEGRSVEINFTRDDVVCIVNRDFRIEDRDYVLRALNGYAASEPLGTARVHLAILKLSRGKVDLVEQYVKVALRDFRDVLAPAESPRCSELGFSGYAKLSLAQRAQLERQDRKDWLFWLHGAFAEP